MSTTVTEYSDSIRRRALADKSDIILCPDHNPEMLAVCVGKSWCADSNYMLKREAEKVTSLGSNTFKYKDTVTSLEELRFFSGITGSLGNSLGYCRLCETFLLPPNATTLGADGLRRSNSIKLLVCGKKLTTINARNFYQWNGSPGISSNAARAVLIFLHPTNVVSLNSNNTNAASIIKEIYVPDNLVDSYKATGTWASTYASKIYGLSDLPSQYQKYVDYYD